MPGTGGQQGPRGVRRPWQIAGIFAGLDFGGIVVMSWLNGSLTLRALVIGAASAVIVFVVFGVLISAYRIAGD